MSKSKDRRASGPVEKKVRETSSRADARRFPRYPASGVWSEPVRDAHRQQRDSIIRDAGLQPDAEPGAAAEDD